MEGFVIKDGVFCKYEGPEVEVLEIPDGVVSVCRGALESSRESMRKCKKIIFPASVKELGEHLILSNYDHRFDALEEVVFKGDIKVIGAGAFRYIDSYSNEIGKIGLKKIVFEGHVEKIEDNAFLGSRITSVLAPNGIDVLGNWVFNGCMNLEEVSIPGLREMGIGCFLDCKKLTKLDIPSNCKVSNETFTGCQGLANADGQVIYNGVLFNARDNRGWSWDNKDKRKWKSIPEGVLVIDDYALDSGDEIVIPSSVKTIKKQRNLYSIGFAEDYFETDQKLSGTGFLYLLEDIWIKKISAKDWAYLYLYQTGKNIENLLEKRKLDINSIIEGMLEALEKYGKEKHFVKAAEYIIGNVDSISTENIQKMNDLVVAKKSKKAHSLLKPYLEGMPSVDENDIYSEWRLVYNEHLLDKSIKSNKGNVKRFAKIRLSGTEELAPAFIVKCAVVPYLDLYTERPKYISGYRTNYINIKIIELADKAAGLLNIGDVQELLEKEYAQVGSAWLIPYGRYASASQISTLISNMRKWENWYAYGATGRSDIIIARGALMLSETREAMMNIDKKGLLDDYAKLRKTDADSIRDSVLAEFGLDASGKKEYDLGTKKVIVSLAQDLTLVIYDTVEGKIVKSIPKKGTDPELVEKATADFAEMKKNVKKVIKGRNDILFEDFLSGKTRPAKSWIASYTQNPLLRRVAELIVWNQGKSTFILTSDGVVDCNGNAYEISNETAIGVAHPIEMKKIEIEAWQKYFTSHGLKQPFSQIWEPVIDQDSIQEDRYKGCLIPFYRFRSQGKHGITVEDNNFHNDIDIYFDDCDADVERIDWRRHDINNDDNFEVTSFSFRKYTRQVNHIVTYLDRVTVSGRILKDDTSIAMYLEGFTLAQITEFINLAMENNCTNCLAVLMDYKNNKYSTYDPMDAFTLE